MIPTDTVAAGGVWYTPFIAQMVVMHRLANFDYFTNILCGLADGSWLLLYPPARNAATYSISVSGPGRAKPVGSITFFLSNDSVASSFFPTTGFGMDLLTQSSWVNFLSLGLMQQAWAEIGFGLGVGDAADIGYSGLSSALVNASGTRIGLFGTSFSLGQLRSLLMTVNLTKNSHAFMLDSRNMIVATTQKFNITKWRGPYNASLSYGPDCYNSSSVGVGVVCRYSPPRYPFAPLQALAARSAQLLNTSTDLATNGAELMRLNGKTYYVSVARIVCQSR